MLVYPKKKIGVDAILYKYISFKQIDKTTLKPFASNFDSEELSCDWNKYSTPEKTRRLLSRQYKFNSKEFKKPDEYFICQFRVSNLLDLDPKQLFLHDPIFYFPSKIGFPNNRSHSLIAGKKEKEKVKSRGQLAILNEWVLFDESEFRLLIA